MALAFTGPADNSKFAIASTETGYDVTDYKQRLEDPKFPKLNTNGTRIGFWSGFDESLAVTITGEVNGDLDSVPPIQLASAGAITVSNLFDMGVTAGGVYHDSSEVMQSRGPSIATFTTDATRLPNVA